MATPDDVYFSVPGVATVRWDAPNLTVFVEWDGWANTAEFGALLEAEVKALHEHDASRLLADCRRQRVLNPADQERADREWVPRALEAGLKRFAIVLPVSDMAASHLQERLGKVPKTAMQIAYFGSVEEARAWLAS
jgi:stage II sporulation SpoAA-like protein